MKFQNLFWGAKNKETISICRLLRILPRVLSIKIDFYSESSYNHKSVDLRAGLLTQIQRPLAGTFEQSLTKLITFLKLHFLV